MKPAIFLLITAVLAASEPPRAALTLAAGQGELIDCPAGVARVSTSNPDVVDAIVASDTEVLFHSKALGQATLVIWSKNGDRRTFDVTVEPNLAPFRTMLKQTFPDENIDVRASRESLALVGSASSQSVADRALALVSATVKGAVSNLRVAAAPSERQILLRVRFAELNRSAATEFGVSLLSTGALRMPGAIATGQFPTGSIDQLTGGVPSSSQSSTKFALSDILNIFAFRPDLNLGLLLRDLETRGLLQVLAEPNLVATNGKEATFLAGGEFPVPVLQSGASAGSVTVQFREFGIRLTFLPTLTSYGTIRMHVRPEVSTVDAANGVTVSGFRIPALSTRRVETDVELAEGQSFVIAGMLDQRVVEGFSRLPGFARVPIFGALFRSRAQTRNKTELVVVVTPEAGVPLDTPPPGIEMPLKFLGPVTERKSK
jgi:pilus assembly protein CpaC